MAKVTKNKKITMGEILVPAEEQPFEIPENWIWVRPLSVFSIEYGKGLSTKDLTEDGYPVFGANGQIGYYSEYMYDEERALMSCRGAYSGIMNKSLPYSFVTSNSLVITPKGINMSSKYICYLFSALKTSRLVSGTAQPQVTVQAFRDFEIPLPPISEQQRIVTQIDSLFTKLDEAKEKAIEAVERLDDEYQSILHDAFTGELTNNWRVYNKKDYTYSDLPLSDLVSDIRYGSSEKSNYENKGTPVLRIPNIENGEITFEDIKYLPEELDNDAHEAKENDILIIRSNGSRDLVGKCALVPKLEKKYAYASFLMRIKTNEKVNPRYLSMYINSSMARRQLFVKAKSSSGIHNINSKELGAVRIYIPSIEEQNQIVEIVDELLNRIRTAKTISENVCSCIDEVKKAILAKAFRGELGTNDPSEESSIELLKQIIANE